jgi:hypothetical protein
MRGLRSSRSLANNACEKPDLGTLGMGCADFI